MWEFLFKVKETDNSNWLVNGDTRLPLIHFGNLIQTHAVYENEWIPSRRRSLFVGIKSMWSTESGKTIVDFLTACFALEKFTKLPNAALGKFLRYFGERRKNEIPRATSSTCKKVSTYCQWLTDNSPTALIPEKNPHWNCLWQTFAIGFCYY